MSPRPTERFAPLDVLSIILGGGKGTRLYPLTRNRAKPAVPFGGKYRLVDIPLSNCINAGLRQIYVLTQFNSSSLHNHISQTFRFDSFSRGFVQILAAEQTFERSDWYQGTADAVRQNLVHLHDHSPTCYLILSGDQLYHMRMEELIRHHVDTGADITVAASPVERSRAGSLGILGCDEQGRVHSFVEKPGKGVNIDHLRLPSPLARRHGISGRRFPASMGIYVFSPEVLERALENSMNDFGKEVLPACLERWSVQAFLFCDFWEDIGTIRGFYEANLDLAAEEPDFTLYHDRRPIYSRRRDLPPSRVHAARFSHALVSDGCIIREAEIRRSLVGIRSVVGPGTEMDGVICMGADYHETAEQRAQNDARGIPDMGIGEGCVIRRAIIDKNARIGRDCRIGCRDEYSDRLDTEDYAVRSGIIVIPKNGVLPPGTVI